MPGYNHRSQSLDGVLNVIQSNVAKLPRDVDRLALKVLPPPSLTMRCQGRRQLVAFAQLDHLPPDAVIDNRSWIIRPVASIDDRIMFSAIIGIY